MTEVCCLALEENLRAPEALVDEKVDDKRRGYWCIVITQIYREGIAGVEQDLEQAIRYAELAGSLGYAEGYNLIAAFLMEEENNWEEAKEYWEKAAALNFGVAFNNLGKAFLSGKFGGNVDYVAAKKMFHKSAQLGDVEGLFCLGLMHANGNGMPRNFEKAVKYYQKGANKGQPNSLLNLGLCYAYGEGVPQSFERA